MSKDQISVFIESIPLDLRVEVVLNDLMKAGYTLDDYFIKPVGIFKRRFGKDIARVEKVQLENNTEIYNIHVNREGFYDMLPQGLFHNPPGKGTKAFKTATEMSEEVKLRLKQEREAREFFHIYEIELYNLRLSVEWNERKLIETISITMDDEDFLSYWELPAIFNRTQKGILFYLYPIIDTIRGNIPLMEKAYSLILNETVQIRKLNTGHMSINSIQGYNILGKKNLGLDFVLGSLATPVYQTLLIEVGPVANTDLIYYLRKGRGLRIIQQLNRFLMPLFLESEIKIISENNNWLLGEEKSGTRLGYNVTL